MGKLLVQLEAYIHKNIIDTERLPLNGKRCSNKLPNLLRNESQKISQRR
ncbi:MAG: hypothetical protein R3C26_24665 [Calditrichia bacterium]